MACRHDLQRPNGKDAHLSTHGTIGRSTASVVAASRAVLPRGAGVRSRAILPRALASQSGMTLIEVLIASVITAFIAIGTFTAFDAAGKSSADERAHAQGTLLTQQDQDRLRSFTTTTLAQMGTVTTYRAENGMCLEKSGSGYVLLERGEKHPLLRKSHGLRGLRVQGHRLHGHLLVQLRVGRKRRRKSCLYLRKIGR